MAVIGFSDKPEEIWCVAGWVLRQLLGDVISQYPEDVKMADEFTEALALSGLHIDLLKPELAARITKALRQVSTGILAGEIRSGIYDWQYSDTKTIEQYREALSELLEAIPPRIDNNP